MALTSASLEALNEFALRALTILAALVAASASVTAALLPMVSKIVLALPAVVSTSTLTLLINSLTAVLDASTTYSILESAIPCALK